MAYVNYPSAQPSGEINNTPPPKQKNNKQNLIIGLLVAALLGAGGYIFYLNNKKNETQQKVENTTTILEQTTADKELLQTQFDAVSYRLDSMSGLNANLATQIASKDGQIAKLKDELRTLLSKAKKGEATAQELARAKAIIEELNAKVNDMATQIASLKENVATLTNEKAEAIVARDAEVSKNQVLTDEKKKLEETVDIGSTLRADEFDIAGINVKGSGKEKESKRVNHIDKLKISFRIGENKITKTGEKELYMVITQPDGSPLAVEALGSGRFTSREGQDIIYTKKVNINYTQGQSQHVATYWEQEGDLKSGTYNIDIYQNGFKIGSGSKTFKKKSFLGL
jgi:flagellar basal body-associated protein FliL